MLLNATMATKPKYINGRFKIATLMPFHKKPKKTLKNKQSQYLQ